MADTFFSRGRILGLALAAIVILAGLAAATGHVSWKLVPDADDRAAAGGETVLDWDFADGPFPDGWGWGTWRVVDDCLEISAGPGEIAVYFTPAVHGADFVLETRVRLGDERGVRAHLLTRDSKQMTHEAGVVLERAPGKVAVRNMVNGRNYVSDLVPSPVAPGDTGWHDMKVAVAGGLVSAWIDGDLVYEAEHPAPPGFYTEPHLAAENGTVRFRGIRIRSTSGS
jgi:hypothetical protein